MPFDVGSLVATLRIEGLDKYTRDVNQAGVVLTNAGQKANRAGQVAAGALRGASLAVGALTVATGVWLTQTFKTGLAYNQLQQQSRAAMKTILGGAKQANAQMDKLDAFATKSPFAKQVFITAQQQLLAFGRATDKVLPDLNAMQDAVAAMGGSSNDLAHLAFVFAQIQSAGKITGQDLMQFGQMGVDAATLIGKQMGKTGGQIRSEITAGSLDATKALDALSKGMEQRFGGAAANVKNTIAGTIDRIHAATRDIGSALAEPFVGHKGGGRFIEWGNDLADVLRAAQKQISPLADLVMHRLDPAFDAIGRGLKRAKDVADRFDVSKVNRGLELLGRNEPAISGIAGAMLAMNTNALKGIPVLGDLIPKINPIVAGIAAIALTSPEMRDGLRDIFDALKPLLPVVGDLATALSRDLSAAVGPAADLLEVFADVAKPIAGLIAGIPGPVILMVGAFVALRKANTGLAGLLARAGDQAVGMAGKLGIAGGAADGFKGMLGGVSTFLTGPWGLAIGAAAAIIGGVFMSRIANAKHEVDEFTDSLDKNTGAMTKNTREQVFNSLQKNGGIAYAKQLGINLNLLTDAALGNTDAQAKLGAKLDEIRDKADKGAGLWDAHGRKLAEDATIADRLAEAYGLTNKRVQEGLDQKADELAAMDATTKARDAVKDATKKYNDQVRENNKLFKDTPGLYAQNRQALDDLAKKARDYVDTVRSQTRSTKETTRAQADMAGEIIHAARQMGMGEDAAKKYAAKILGIPEKRLTKILLEAEEAKREAAALKRSLDAAARDRTATIYLLEKSPSRGTSPYARLAQADRGIVGFAGGGIRENHIAQIARPGTWRVWAEPETGGEAYIPLAPSKRSRSLQIWEEVGRRLQAFADGGMVTTAGARLSALPARATTVPVATGPQPLIGGSVYFGASEAGKVRSDLDDLTFYLRSVKRGGRSV